MAVPIDIFFLDHDGEGTLQARIQQMVAEAILSGRLRRGEKLPSTRRLAAHLGVSRITVTLAYTELVANDFLTSRGRSGYFVSPNAPEPPVFSESRTQADTMNWPRVIARRFSGGGTPRKPVDWRAYAYPFTYGQPDERLFDYNSWRLCAMKALGRREQAPVIRDWYDRDDPDLVDFVARHILPRRGITAGPAEILITLGAQNALWLAAQVLLDPTRRAAFEEPGYYSLRDILAQSGCRMAPVAVDRNGMQPDLVPDGTDVIFTTPSHQFPTSATMPLARRKALLRRASRLNAVIVEDDYEFEMSFLRPASPALKSLDREGRVLYVGSFSKSLFPGLRLGYLVGSPAVLGEARALRSAVLRHPPGLTQRITAHYLSLGYYDAMISRMKRAFEHRRQVMDQAISDHGLTIAGRGVYGGSSFWMRAPDGVDMGQVGDALARQEVLIEPGAPFFARSDPPLNFYRLAYSSIPADRIATGIARIAAAINAAGVGEPGSPLDRKARGGGGGFP
ncbi:MAG TPA: PLP-dependent aminotransferase family protein [Aliiroseovarius sp.]|nr:PLP-dependent aminotransferase family protein [Aliiroseovarius sp.]